ncbi:efflux RND transporter periplasmic adaptor subunit, partial [bacterium]|nr:efflux RND transporter periplasmic adaptor subunit [bacterium]
LITRYEIRAPFSGQITEKHITLGEYVKDEDSIFTISDLSRVWVNLTLYQKDLPYIQTGQPADIQFPLSDQHASGTISFISPMLDLHTRTGTARVVIDNTSGIWRPGMFINASIAVEEHSAAVYIPNSAIMNINNHPTVFVQAENGFEPIPIVIGRKNSTGSEIISGLNEGDLYVSSGGFSLKAELDKEAFAHAGHAH